jgi:lipopolysaccharide/colanic/teichoic acid biosynthesis glycosyltransferase
MHDTKTKDLRQARRGDERIYPFGRFLRRVSLDEIPQFLNVLTGDMSVVGPRPHISEHDVLFTQTAEIYRMRFFVKPGITGLAQSRGFRGEVTTAREIQQRTRLDLIYIRSWSVWMDLAIIFRTFGQLLSPPKSAC